MLAAQTRCLDRPHAAHRAAAIRVKPLGATTTRRNNPLITGDDASPPQQQHVSVREQSLLPLRQAGPQTPSPDFTEVDAQPLSQVIMGLFRRKMVAALGEDTPAQGYDGIIKLTRRLNSKFPTHRDTQERTVVILRSLFPSWLPRLFRIMFAKPFPAFSSTMNALATALSCKWLMGPLKINDVEMDGGEVGFKNGVLVERCRYLEEAGCASICINSCKVPTQEFFMNDMGLPLSMTPNYDDFSCQFSFGKTPEPQATDPVFSTACFNQCPTKKQTNTGTCAKVQAMFDAMP